MKPFKIKTIELGEGEKCVYFKNRPIILQTPPTINILNELGLTQEEYVKGANLLFEKYHVKIPDNYPAECIRNLELYGKIFLDPWTEFTICIGCCILIDKRYNLDVSRIIKKELIENNSRSGILHAETLSNIILYYLNKGKEVEILKEKNKKYNPDMNIDGYSCEVKVVDESDWTHDIDMKSGKGRRTYISEDICYDLGQFISKENCGHKGIKQSDIIFADLSKKSFGFLEKMELNSNNNIGLPKLQNFRIIYFAKWILNFYSYYIDFDSSLWALIKDSENTHGFSIYPSPNAGPIKLKAKKASFKGQSSEKK